MKDFEDTDREGTTMDSRKPLGAGEIEELQATAFFAHGLGGMLNESEVAALCAAVPRIISMLAQAQHESAILSRVIDATGYEGHLDAMPERLAAMLTPPPDAAVREAVAEAEIAIIHEEHLHNMGECCTIRSSHLRALLRAVQAPRLTPEQVEAVKMAETLLTDTMSDYGDCEHDVGHCICKYHSGVFSLRSAFPDLFTGEVGRG